LPLPTQPTIPTATKVASSATKSFFMLTPCSSEGAKIKGQNQARLVLQSHRASKTVIAIQTKMPVVLTRRTG
jgi:hypothetical protein